MAKFVSVDSVSYDAPTNTLRASLKDIDGKETGFEMDGLAFAELMGQANLKNAVARHLQVGRPLPLIPVTGVQTGMASHGEPKQYSMVLSIMAHQMGLLHFFLPPEVEIALREKLKGAQPS